MGNADLATLLSAPLLGPDQLSFMSGEAADVAAVERLLAWLGTLGGGAWWRCLEWTDRVRLQEGPPDLPPDIETLVWGRWFAHPGDLELWRDGLGFRWRFVGEAQGEDAVPPPGVEADFFAAADGSRLRAGPDARHLLWKAGDARVATADADTMEYLRARPRQAAVCTVYYDHGSVAAVRYRRLEPYVP